MEVIIRPAEINDVGEILEIVNHEILNSTVIYDYEERTFEQQLKWFEQKKASRMPVIVADDGNRVLGFGTYGIFRPWAAYQYSAEHSIYVRKDHRASGIGQKLMANLIELARLNGFHTMIAGVDGTNEKSIDFHKKFGFTEVGTFKEVGFKFNQWLDLRFLQLILE